MQRNKIYRLLALLTLTFVFMLSLSACSKTLPEGEEVYLSYINTQRTGLVEQKTYLTGERTIEQIDEVLSLMATPSLKVEYYAPLSQELSVISRSYIAGKLTINFTENYKELDAATEILTRASIVKSLTQIEGVERVAFCIKGQPLKDKLNKEVGTMTVSSFVDS